MKVLALSARERDMFRQKLREMTERLARGVSQLEAEALRPAAEQPVPAPPAHEADRAVRESEEEVARTLLLTEEQLLEEVNAALERLEKGTFGTCEKCGHPIARVRLDAMPYARTCIRCARAEQAAPAE